MAIWHCPHCGAAQTETARCWVCRKSSTTCSTCRHFRASIAADVGYCALDRRRRPLTGLELRGCWSQGPSLAGEPSKDASLSSAPGRDHLRHPALAPARGFVPIEEVGPPPEPEAVPASTFLLADAGHGWEARTSLFGEQER